MENIISFNVSCSSKKTCKTHMTLQDAHDIVEVRYFDCGSLEVVWIFWRRFFSKDEIKMKHFERDKIVWMNCTLFSRGIFSENPFSKTICLSNFFSWCRKKVEALTTVVRWSVSILFKIHGILYYISRGLNLF